MKPMTWLAAALAFASLTAPRIASATTEICGNDIDDDGNGLTDEGCYPALSTGVCESPLSCADTGMVSWTTGSLHYDLPPDVAPIVPYGPSIGFRRFYTSMYTPGSSPTSVNKTPLGPGWQHTYMTWIDRYTVSTVYHVILHTSQGRDTDYTYSSTSAGWESYTPQNGEHVLSLKRNTASPFQYQVQLLTGETIVYNQYGQVTEIWDTEPTPNKVLITWDSTTNGNVSTVTDAAGERRLLFSYSNGLMSSLQYQLLTSGTWTTEHTTSYGYSNGVPRDATSGWYVPGNSSQWTSLLSGTGLPNPSNLWLMQETSGNISDSIGSDTGIVSGCSYGVSETNWTRKGINGLDGHSQYISVGSSTTGSAMLLQYLGLKTNPPSGAHALNNISGTNWEEAQLVNGPKLQARSGSNFATGTTSRSGSLIVASKLDVTHGEFVVYSDQGDVLKPTYSPQYGEGTTYMAGDDDEASDADVLYAAQFDGSAAELSDAQVTTLMSLLKNGQGLTSVTIGGQLAQQYTYAGGSLAKISDGAGNLIAAFSYSSTSSGQVDLVATPHGTVGFEYGSSRTSCSGDTVLYFNKGNTSSCSADSDCGTGYLCGGKTGTGATGECFLAARCMTTATVNGESAVTSISPLGPGGGSCTGACTEVAQYVWSQGVGSNPSGLLNVAGREDPLGGYTSILYNSNGLPVQIGYADTDADPTNTGSQRTTYLAYDTTFPGRLSSTRRQTDLQSGYGGCGPTGTAYCEVTSYSYGSDNQLQAVEHDGNTLNSSGSIVGFTTVVGYVHDAQGRLTETHVSNGTLTYNQTKFNYFTSSDPTKNGFLENSQAYKDSSHYLERQILTYDFWGHPTAVQAPDGNLACDTYDSSRGFLTSRRIAMAGQTSCSSPNSADLTTSWARDSALRLSQLTRPDGSCVFYIYDSTGRLFQVKRRDDCNASSTGDTAQWNYTADSLVSEIDYYNSSGTLTAAKPYKYYDSRKLAEIVNPVNTSQFTGLVYDDAGDLQEIDGAASLSKTTYSINSDHRVTAVSEYKSSSAYDTWSLLYSWQGLQSRVEDGDSLTTGSTRDDAGRVVQISSPDMRAPTIRVYNAANQLTTIVEASGIDNYTHSFSFDELNRPLNDDYYGSCATSGTAHPEIMRSYDALPTGYTCPVSGGCNNLAGRVALIEVTLMCSSAYSSTDGALDQFTYYNYDDAGRVVNEYITDDSGRNVTQTYTYTKNGAQSQVTTPSSVVIGATFGSTSNNSDSDLVTAVWRTSTSTPVADTVEWAPFGPWMQYNWEASIGGSHLRNRVARNLAYRISEVFGAEYQSGSASNDSVTITEDAKGRATSRVYSPHNPTLAGLYDSYFQYDEQDRVICETTDFLTICPSSGSDIKNSHDLSPPFTSAGDWQQLLRPIAGSAGGLTHGFGLQSGTHKIGSVVQTDGTPNFGTTGFDYDDLGDREDESNKGYLSYDGRSYTYDGRHNVINVRGQYYTGSAWHEYDVASAFDAYNRRVFKSFYDETTGKTAEWFFYYDTGGHLVEVNHIPDSSAPSTYSVFQLFWLRYKLVAYWQTDYPTVTTSKRYVTADETDRPIKMWNWPSSGDAARYWAINPSAWGDDTNLPYVSGMYQPVLFTGQYQDAETAAYEDDGVTVHRPGLALNGARTYDPFTGGYLQMDPLSDETWSSYLYVHSNPVGASDPSGKADQGPEYVNILEIINWVTPCAVDDANCWGPPPINNPPPTVPGSDPPPPLPTSGGPATVKPGECDEQDYTKTGEDSCGPQPTQVIADCIIWAACIFDHGVNQCDCDAGANYATFNYLDCILAKNQEWTQNKNACKQIPPAGPPRFNGGLTSGEATGFSR